MKNAIAHLLMMTILTYAGYGQNKQIEPVKSNSKHIIYLPPKEAKTVKFLPDLVIKDYIFTDENNNKIIDADENNTITLKLENKGKGMAQAVVFKTSLRNPANGLTFTPQINIGDLYPGQSYDIKIPLKSNLILNSGIANFRFEATELRGFDALPLDLTITTHQFIEPKVRLVDAVFSTDEGGKIRLNYPINLKVLIQNLGKGVAKDVRVEFKFLKDNCIMLGDKDYFNLGNLEPGQTVELEFPFTATRKYTAEQIPLKVDLSERYQTYSKDSLMLVSFNQDLPGKDVVMPILTAGKGDLTVASLVPDVDRNIPVDSLKNTKKYALVIGNEDYKSKQRGISTEANVIFARRDASIFRDYLLNTLGFVSENIFLLQDATAAEMFQFLDVVAKLAQKTTGSEIIFYYAGHGFPDESTQVPYLVPVDVSATNLVAAIKLSDVYNRLENSYAEKITIFLDACFSGGGRSSELLASRGILVKPKLDIPAENTIIFSASSGEQSSLPYNEKQHGIFTYYLLKKLQESRGNITYGQLAAYLQNEVSLQSLRINKKEQDPQVIYGDNNSENWINRMIK